MNQREKMEETEFADESFEWDWNEDDEEEESDFKINQENADHEFNLDNLKDNLTNKRSIDDDDDSFASDFYKCGTDWSPLISSPADGKSKKLKQTSLLHLWGVPKPSTSPSSNPNNKLKQTSLLQLWGVPKPSSPSNPNNAAALPSPSLLKKGNKRSNSGLFKSDPAPPRACPFYKKIPGTNFTVDAFRYGSIKACSAYFLTHFHADHYGGLNKSWSHGPIYCTPITARLVKMCLYVNPSFLHPLELDTEYVIEGIRVTMLEANHCPGAALILFHLLDGQCFLHTGDFRASRQMQTNPLLINQHVNVLYLDTTYCNPKYRFPSKETVLNFVLRITKSWLQKQPRTLIIVGAYSIGKESVYLAIAKEMQVKIYANASRRRILQTFGWPDISGNLSTNGKDTPLHVLPISSLKIEVLESYLKTYVGHYTSVLAFRPTGWTYSESVGDQLDLIKPKSRGPITVYGVPYSEHSSFSELQEFIQFLKPERIIPTVNVGNAAIRDKMQSYFREWLKDR